MSDAPEKKRRFRIGCLGMCACTLGVFILTCIGVKLYMVHALGSALDALRDAGEPVTRAEVLATIDPIPDEENAALVLQPQLRAITGWAETPPGLVLCSNHYLEFGLRPSNEMLDILRNGMATNATALGTLHDAAKLPHARWPQPANPPVESFEHLSAVRRGSWLLENEVWLRAAEGDATGTTRALFAALRLAHSLDSTPEFIGALTQRRAEENALGAVETALSLTALSAQDLAMLRAELTTGAKPLSHSLCTRTERANLLWYITDPSGRRKMLEGFDEDGMGKALSFLPGVVEADALYLLRFLNTWGAISDMPYREQLAAARRFTADAAVNPPGKHDPRWASRFLFENLCRAYGHASSSLVKAVLRRDIARAALAVEQFRIERKRWPSKLAELVPDYLDAVPQDYFAPAGTTISYHRTPTGARLWSRWDLGHGGLTPDDVSTMSRLARDINEFNDDKGRLPKTLDELVPDTRKSIPIDPRTGKPWAYRRNAANPKLFILGDFTNGLTEDEFWKQDMTTYDWAWTHVSLRVALFRLLDPKLRGATQARFCDELASAFDHAIGLHKLGYTPERLKQLGFDDDFMDDYNAEVKEFEESQPDDDEEP